ncbi:hypothetical protein CGL51_05510 [Pyrobaculum aerophilum]|uniref:Uncharacterized protein n=1 Tax=Pyrobaculum aerophilum TaxID=13773 RepID=A0A371R774_9CREN|nr:hypothetical protein CGL51_05510 [Pyrobaculum aerophilum]RFB00361.1 hypothetical protein CGL52_00420 [Pyrobaculum aerophilum]
MALMRAGLGGLKRGFYTAAKGPEQDAVAGRSPALSTQNAEMTRAAVAGHQRATRPAQGIRVS